MIRRLKLQGVNVSSVDSKGGVEDDDDKSKTAGMSSGGQTQRGRRVAEGGNPTFTSSIQLGGVGPAKGAAVVGRSAPSKAVRGSVAADHVDIHQSDLKGTLGYAVRDGSSNGNGGSAGGAKKSMTLGEVQGMGSVTATLERLREQLAQRGARGIIGVGRKFRIMDDSGNGSLSMSEFKKAMQECALTLKDDELSQLFKHFDKDSSGDIDFEEFLGGVRGPMNPRRMSFVSMAFAILDEDGNGYVEPSDIVKAYNADKHPDVIAGKKTAQEVLREFLDTFDVGGEKDGKVTRNEFENYYKNVSASVDNDDYFELMMRNAWHISGGSGWCESSANRRVLVTDSKGNQSVQEIKKDLGMKADDKEDMIRRLKLQGVDAASVDFKGGTEDDKKKGDPFAGKPPKKENPNFKKTSLW